MKASNIVKSIVGGVAAGIGHAAGSDIFVRVKKAIQEEKRKRAEEQKKLSEQK